MAKGLTDEQVELEIARLLDSPYVKLAKQEERIRCRRRQYMYNLRAMEKKRPEAGRSRPHAGDAGSRLLC